MATQAIPLKVTLRSELGSRANRRLRRDGKVPAIVYGHKEAVLPVSVDGREVAHHVQLGAHVFDLDLGGRSEKVLLKDVQYDHLGIAILHIDFTRVSLDERVKVTVPIELKGEPKGREEGGVLQQIMAQLQVECGVLDIPQAIVHNVSDMALDAVLKVRDLKLPEGVRALADGELIVATVRIVLEAAPAAVPEAAAAAEPEVIGRKAAEEEAPAEGAEKPAKAEKAEKK
jgi:large subunit ribosomal protein L25